VTSIGDYAFDGCYKLVEVYNLSSLKITAGYSSYGYVGYYAKVIHTSLSEPSILATTADGYTFCYVNDTGYLVGYTGSETDLVLPSSFVYNGTTVTTYQINQHAFYWNTQLTSVTIPSSVTFIGSGAFNGCNRLTRVVFENTSGWWYSSDSTATSGTTLSSSSLSNAATAAQYLTSTYYAYYWHRS
jgi:hypothetical protein